MTEMVEFELVSPERLLKSEAVEMVVVPGEGGDFGVLPNHSQFITTVRPGIINIYKDGKISESIFVGGGFCEVSPERCTVLAEEAIAVGEIDKSTAESRLATANEALASAEKDEYAAAEADVKLAEAYISAATDTN